MFGKLLRSVMAWFERIKPSSKPLPQVTIASTNLQIVEKCQEFASLTQERLDRKFHPLEAKLLFVKTTHPNITELVKFLRMINEELGSKKPKLLQSEFPYDVTDIPLDALFVSSSGMYIPQSTIGELVIETNRMLEFARTLAQAEAGIEEYHFRMLLKTIRSLTSIHGAISTVLAD